MMKLTQLFLKNFTIFSEFTIEFSPGINVLIGQNGVGKTHILKILYAACKTSKLAESLPYNLVKTFRPEDGSLDPLMHRGVPKVSPTIIRVSTPDATLECAFSSGAIYQDAPVMASGHGAPKERYGASSSRQKTCCLTSLWVRKQTLPEPFSIWTTPRST